MLRKKPAEMRVRRFLGGLLTVFCIFSTFSNAIPAYAATGVPEIINHQGRLLNSSGTLLTGSYCFQFSLYSAASGGTKLWPAGTPSTMTVAVTNGVFSVGIGDTSAGGDTLDYNFNDSDTVYLNIDVASQVSGSCVGASFETLAPRHRIFSAPYALNVNTVGGYSPAQSASGNQIPVLTSDDLVLGGVDPQINATAANVLLLQGGAGTGDVQFFSSLNKLTSSGALTVAGTVTSGGLSISAGSVSLPSGSIDSTEILNATITGDDIATSIAGAGLALTAGSPDTLDIASANGAIVVNADNIALTLAPATNGLSATSSSGSGLEVLATGVALIQGCADGELLKWNETADTWGCDTDDSGAGSTAWDTISDPSGNGAVSMAQTSQTLDWNMASDATLNGLTMTMLNDVAGSSNQKLLTLTNSDDAGSDGVTEALLVLNNADTNEAVTAAIQFVNAGGNFTNIFDNEGTLISGSELNILDGGILLSELTNTGTLTATTVDINGGNIDGTAIGATTPSTGVFTSVTTPSILTGDVALSIGDATTDTITFATDGTGNGEFTFPADVIGDADLDWGAGAGQISVADLETVDNILLETEIDASSELLAIMDDETGTGALVFADSPTFADDITIQAAGVKLTGDGDGALTILGLGNGFDEDLTLNLDDVDNTGTFTSSTLLATLNFSGIALQESGIAVLNNDEIDASSELLAIMDDETGTGALVFGTAPTFTTSITTPAILTGNMGLAIGDDATDSITFATDGTGNGEFTFPADVIGDADLDWGAGAGQISVADLETADNILLETEIDASSELLAIMDDETGTGALVFGTAPTFTTSIQIGAAGVVLSDDADGALTLLGAGNGFDEDLTLNLDDVDNTGTFTSSTLLATLNFSGIALQESGIAVLNNDEIDASSELLAIMDDETGTGVLVFGTAPTFTTSITTPSILTGDVALSIGDDTTNSISFATDGTGNGEFTFPADAIGDADLDWGAGAGQISVADLETADNILLETEIDASSELLAIMDDETGTGALVFGTAPTFTTSIQIGAAGVAIVGPTGLTDGTITFLGAGAGADEDLTLNLDDVLDTGTFTSSTGLATLNFSGIALQESGVGVLNSDEIDASSELLAIMDDETGSGVLVFGTAPTFTTSITTPSILTGDVALSIGDDTTNSISFATDGTGNGEFTFPADAIGDADLDWGAGAGQISVVDLETADNILLETEIDASSELLAIMDDETGTGALVFGTAPTFTTSITTPSILTGNVGLSIGDIGTDSVTFVADGTGNAEFTFPADVIGDADLDWGAGAGQISVVDLEAGVDNILLETEIDASSELLAIMDDETGTGALVFGTAPTFTTSITTPSILTGDVALSIGDATTDTITFATDGTGNGEFVFPADVIGDADLDWGVGVGQISVVDLEAGVDNILLETEIDASSELLALMDDETGTGALVFADSPTFADDVTLNAAGVKLTGDGDGALTILGLGDGSDEDLTINLDDTSNHIVLSSSTSVTDFDLTGMDLLVGGADVTVGSTGVKLSSDNDGAMTFTSLGDGFKEDLIFNFDDTSNTVTVTSTTGVTVLDLGTIGLSASITGTLTATTVDVDGGSIDGTSVGLDVPAGGAFTTLTSTGITTLGNDTNTVAIDSSSWNIDTTGALTGVTFDANGAGNSLSNVENADLANDTIDLSKVSDTLTMDSDVTLSSGSAINDYKFVVDNSSTGEILTMMSITTSGTGAAIANALDLSDPDIATALALGYNDVAVNGITLTAAELSVLGSGIALSELTNSGTLTATTVDINGGNIDGTAIGAATPSTGVFSSLTVSTAAGVQLTGDGDGAITFLGLGDGFDEDLTLNLDDVDNTGTFTSSTLLATLNFSGIALQESGVGVLNNDEIDASSELLAIMDDETGTGALVFGTAPTFTTSITTPSILTGDVALSIGDATTDTITFATDGTGNGEFVFPADVIGDADIDWGVGAGQIDVTDVEGGVVNILLESEIDASSELLAIMDDETGTGALTFADSPTFADDITIQAAGVKLTGDGDGALTILGLGNGFDEDLTLNLDDVQDVGTFTSSTGLVTLNFSSIALQESGINVLNNDEIDASSELLAIMDDETGTGALVFGTAPTFTTSIQIGAAGVAIVGPSAPTDGTITFLGAGAGADEDLTLNLDDVLDTGTFTSSTGLATLNFSGIALQESGINVLNNDEIDASSELLAIMDDETGTGALVFGTAPSFTTSITTPSILTGNVALSIGDATTDSITFVTDSTGNAEFTLPADVIGDADIDWGSGAGQIDVTDIEGGMENILTEGEIDASSELLAIMDDETGTGALVFGTAPTFTTSIQIGAAGVAIVGPSAPTDGTITFLGAGAGADEDLTLNLDDVLDTGTFTSSTGLATLNFSGIALQESGVGVLNNDEIDASSELLAIMDDETGTGALVFGTAPTFTTSITTPSILTGDVALSIGDATTDSITFATDGTGNGEFVFPADVIGDADLDWGAGAGQISVADLETADNILLETEIDASSELLAIMDDETGTGALVFADSPTFADDITIQAAGVKLTGDGDGALTILGLGNGFDEDLTLNLDDVDNTGTFTSSTLLATLNFSGIALQESGVGVLNNDEIDASSELLAIMDDETGTGALVFADSPTFADDITIQAAGVKLTGDGDGALTILGLGNGFDEDLILNLDDVDNTGTFTSSTLLATLNFSGIALQESGVSVLNNDEIDASSELLAIMDDETGTGALVFGTAPTFTTSITTPSILTGDVALSIGDATTDTITFATDGTGNGEFTFPADVIGDADLDWGAGAGQISVADLETADNILLETEIDASSELLAIMDDETGTGALVFADSPTFADDITIQAAGVKLTGDGDGALTILGLGNGFDEDLTLNLDDVDNTGTFTSSTLLATLNFSGIALQESGIAVLNNDEIDSSSELLAIMDDETGTGALVFGTAPTFTTSITTPSILTGDVALSIGDATTDTITFATDGTGNGEFTFPADVIGDADLDWGAGAGQISVADLETADNILLETEIDASSELLAIMDDETGTGALTFATAPTFTTSIQIGAAGVILSDDADGAITLLGLGDGFDENLTLNLDDVDNTGTFTSSTLLATLNFSGIALQESGVGVLNNDEIDASSELLAIMDDETGTGALVFGTAPAFTTSITTPAILTGNVDLNIGDATTNLIKFETDGTGNAEFNLPADVIGDADLDWGTGAGQISVADLETADNILLETEIDASSELLAIMDDETGTGALTFATAPTFTTSIQIGAAGVVLSDDADGALTLVGAGDGFDENLILNLDDVDNTGTFTSSTLLATLNFSGIALQESGVSVLNNDEIDASSELLAIMDDETGTGALVFGTAPAFTTSITTPSILTGNVALTIGDAATDSITFAADGTGNGEFTFPADVIGDADLDWGAGAGQISVADLETADNILLETEIDASSELLAIMDDETGTGALVFGTSPNFTTSISLNADPADAGAIRLSNADYIYSEASVAGIDVSVIGVDASEVVQIGASGASGVTVTPLLTATTGVSAGTLASTGVTTIGNGSATVAIDSSDWNIDATGSMTGIEFNANGSGNSISNIEGGDILDGSIGEADLDIQGALTDEYCLTLETGGGSIYEWQACATTTSWDTIGDPSGAGAINMGTTEQTMDWEFTTAAFDGLIMNFDNNGTSAGVDNGLVLNNAVSTATTVDMNTEALLRIQQLDTNATGATLVDNGILIDAVGNAGMTDGIDITNAGGNITNAIIVNDTAGGVITTGIAFYGALTNIMDIGGTTLLSGTEFSLLDGKTTMLIDSNDLTASDGAGGTSSGSGLEAGTGGIGLLQGCADGQILSWDEANSIWECSTKDVKYETFASTGTWTKPTDAIMVIVEAWGAGGGGGGGANAASSGTAVTGGGGGGGGAYVTTQFAASSLGSTVPVTVGAGGSGGSGGSGAVGADGAIGGSSCFSTTTNCAGTLYLRAYGGGGGSGDGSAGNGGGGGGGSFTSGSTAATATGGAGGGPLGAAANEDNSGSGGAGGATATTTGTDGGAGNLGGGGGAASTTTGAYASGDGGGSIHGGAGGGAGGSINTLGTARNGGDGGFTPSGSSSSGGGNGTTAPTAGGDGTAGIGTGGWGAGGGGAYASGTAGAGGTGGTEGGGGGGGGASIGAGQSGGAGGTGGAGEVRVWTIKGSGADLAEIYATTDTTLEPGDVVSLDPTLIAGVKKSTSAYDPTAIGIISTEPSLVMGTIQDENTSSAIVALTGRVPVKVSDENGPIYAGDYLTTSSIPGVAMKATKAGQVIGQAMTWFEGDASIEGTDQGTILAFIKLDFYNGNPMEKLLPGLAADGEEVSMDILTGRALVRLVEEKPALLESGILSEIATDRLVAGLEIITPKVIADEVAVNTIMPATGTDIAMALSAEGQFIVETTVPASEDGTIPETQNTVISFDAQGNATFAGTVIAQEIDAQTIKGLDIYADRIATLTDTVSELAAASTEEVILEAPEVTATDLASVRDLIALVNSSVTAQSDASIETSETLTARIDSEVASQLTINTTVAAGITALEARMTAAEEKLNAHETTIAELQARLTALEEKQLLDITSLDLSGDLTIAGLSTFGGGVRVDSVASIGDAISFMNDLIIIGRPFFNDDTAGFGVIRTGQTQVRINFAEAYLEQPIVQASVTFEEEVIPADETLEAKLARETALATAETNFLSGTTKFVITRKNKEGFTILLNEPATQDLRFSWIALAVKDAKTQELMESETNVGVGSPDPVGDGAVIDDVGTGRDLSIPEDVIADVILEDNIPEGSAAPVVDGAGDDVGTTPGLSVPEESIIEIPPVQDAVIDDPAINDVGTTLGLSVPGESTTDAPVVETPPEPSGDASWEFVDPGTIIEPEVVPEGV